MDHVQVLIQGRVQGVGFRYFVWERARSLGLAGVVRNRADGGVEVEAEGDRTALGELLAALREGPRAARVTRVEESWSEGPPRHREFQIRG